MKPFLISLMALGLAAQFAAADPINFPTAGVKMDTPKGWKYEIASDSSSIQVTSPDELVSIVFIPLEAKALDAALDAAEKQILKSSPDAKFGEPQTFKVNGMDSIEVVGNGTLEGTPVEISVDILIGNKPIMVLAYIGKGGDKHEKTLANFVQTIKRL